MLPSDNGTSSAPGDDYSFAAQWLACVLPCRRFADVLANADARLGAGVGRYSFTVTDLHRLLLAGLPAHSTLQLYPWQTSSSSSVVKIVNSASKSH